MLGYKAWRAYSAGCDSRAAFLSGLAWVSGGPKAPGLRPVPIVPLPWFLPRTRARISSLRAEGLSFICR